MPTADWVETSARHPQSPAPRARSKPRSPEPPRSGSAARAGRENAPDRGIRRQVVECRPGRCRDSSGGPRRRFTYTPGMLPPRFHAARAGPANRSTSYSERAARCGLWCGGGGVRGALAGAPGGASTPTRRKQMADSDSILGPIFKQPTPADAIAGWAADQQRRQAGAARVAHQRLRRRGAVPGDTAST